MAFVHLHTHSEYSLLDGAVSLESLVERAAELGQNALALTDHGYMYGAASFYQTCMAHNKRCEENIRHNIEVERTGKGEKRYPVQTVKPIIGCEIYFTPDSTLAKGGGYPELYHMILLAKDNVGYRNLMAICSDAAVRGYYYRPRVTLEMLREHSEGLIATSACIAGILARRVNSGDYMDAKHWAETFVDIFGKDDYYVELQDQGLTTRPQHGGNTQHQINIALDKLAKEMGLKTVGTNDIHYLNADDITMQDMVICIGNGDMLDDENRMSAYPETYMKSEEQMREALRGFEDCIDTTQEVADKCNVEIEFGNIILPRFPLDEGETNESRLRLEAMRGLKARYGDPLPQEVVKRFEHEYKIICDKGFPAYFLIVQEFVRWAKQNGIGVGPGRGSAAGSIVSYALDITTFDPLANGLIFERFLSPERTEMPDIDMDFDDERRQDVIQHCRDVYGEDKIAHVITFGTFKAKQAVVDAARVLGYSVGDGQKISKTLPTLGYSLKEALFGNSEKEKPSIPDFKALYDNDENSRKIIDAAMRIEGLTRGEGIHASAVIICRDAVQEHVPVKYDTKGGVVITQYDGAKTAELGLLKMDFLGLRTLTVISKTLANIKKTTGEVYDPDKIPFDDPGIYELFARGDTAGVFQVESPGMCSLLKSMKPDSYSDIVAVIALYRPGPMSMIPDFIARKQGKKKISYYDERLKPILEETYGIMVYQEQVMQISMVMSGFSAGESDKLRKAVAKKKLDLMTKKVYDWSDGSHEEMDKHFVNGAVRNGFDRFVAEKLWKDIIAFASYAFNKSHAAAYGILTMRTAWLKAHYPHEYMAAVLTSYQGKTDQIVHYISSCNHGGIPILPPDINVSGRDFTPTEEGIRFGFAGLRGVGEGVAEEIIAERDRGGPYRSLHDYIDRVDTKLSNKRVVEALVKSGAFDSTGYTRRQLMSFVEVDNLLERATRRQKDRELGQVSMFDMFSGADDEEESFCDDVPAPDGIEWERRQKLAFEKEILGHYVSDHPLSPFADALAEVSDGSLIDVDARDEHDQHIFNDSQVVTFAGMIAAFAVKPTKSGKQWASFTLEDTEGEAACSLFGRAFEQYRGFLREDAIVKVTAKLERGDRGTSLSVKSIEPLDFNEDIPREHVLELHVPKPELNDYMLERLVDVLERYPGQDKVKIFVHDPGGGQCHMELPVSVNTASGGLSSELDATLGPKRARLLTV